MVFSSPRTRVCETLVCSSRIATLACSFAGGLFKSLFCSLSTFSPNSPLPHDHLYRDNPVLAEHRPAACVSCLEDRCANPQGLRDQVRVAGPRPRWPSPHLRPGPAPLQPAGACRRQRQPGLPHAGSFGPAQHAHAAPSPAVGCWEEDGKAGAARLTFVLGHQPLQRRPRHTAEPAFSSLATSAPVPPACSTSTATSGALPWARSASGARAGDVAC